MGADAYSVIELKMIETILSDKTDERRRLFEEAAGVTKYKHRRKAALRKLEGVQADLVRVNDIVVEVQKAVSSLERQARRAEQFNEVKTRLRNLEIDLMEREYAQLHGRIEPLREKFAATDESRLRLTADLTGEDAALEELRAGILGLEKRLAEAQRDVTLQREKIHRVEEKTLVSTERIRALRENVTRLENEKAEYGRELGFLQEHRTGVDSQIGQLKVEEERAEARLREKQADLHGFESTLEEKKSELRGLNESTIDLVKQIAGQQAELEKRKGQAENLRGRASHAAEESEAYGMEIARLSGEITEFTAEDRQQRRLFTEAEMRCYEAEARRAELKSSAEALHRKEVTLRATVERNSAKVDFLKGLIESKEGLSEGVRFLSASEGWTPRRKVTVADAIRADDKYRIAIEAALGEAAGLLLVDSAADVDQAIALLKQEDRGKATFVALDRVPLLETRYVLPGVQGVEGWAAECARYDTEYARLFHYLLDRVLIVDSPETALEVLRTVSGIRCVTLAGEILSGEGLTRGGSRRQDEGGIIGKHHQIEELLRQTGDAERQMEEYERARQSILQEHDAIDLKSLTDVVKAIEKEMNGVEMRIAQLEFEKKRAEDIITRNSELISALSTDADRLVLEISAAEPALVALTERRSEIERAVGAGTQDLARLEEEWNVRSAEVTDLGIALVNARNRRQNAEADLQRTDSAILEAEEALTRTGEEIQRAHEEIVSAESAIEETRAVVTSLHSELVQLDSARAEIQEETRRRRDDAHQRELRIKDQRRSHEDSMRLAHEYELKIAELQGKSDHLKARALEEFEFTLELKTYPEAEFVDFAAIRDEIQALRDKVKSLGNINFAAFEEYSTEKQRFEFLSGQRKDLLEAEKTLLATIEEINQTAQRKFLETFELIRRNFIETFKSLFDPGDECDLKLEAEVDPLEAGIEITAKPRGKRPTSIDLLSGGEKTLTAIALLFAIYLVKPSPFCILDEVDAPLDDANIDRFTRILRKFSDKTQFIVVTHNKRTMEAANALYGVTMEEEGVSKIVTVRFNQQSQVAAAAVATG